MNTLLFNMPMNFVIRIKQHRYIQSICDNRKCRLPELKRLIKFSFEEMIGLKKQK